MESAKKEFIHDHFFKGSMVDICIAQGFSRLLLPDRLSFKIDYSSLSIEKNSTINSELKVRSTDVLYRAETEETKKSLLLLFEHKSFVDSSVELQNYRNTVHIIEDEQSQKKQKKHKLLPVVPIVVYHGNDPWNADNSINGMFELFRGVERFIPQQQNIIIDLSVFPDDKIKGIAEVKAFIFTLKYSRSRLLIAKLPQIIRFFNGVGEDRLRYLEFVIMYLKYCVSQENLIEFSKIIKRELELGDAIMKKNSNIWAELGYVAGLKDGEDIGLKKGEDIGLKKGEKVGFEEGVQFEQEHEDTAQNEAVKRMREKIAAKMLKKGSIPRISASLLVCQLLRF